MPQLRNAKKALRQSERRRLHNQNLKANLSFMTKKTKKLAQAKDAKAEESLKAVIKALDKAAQRGILKKNTAARKKSRLIKQIRKMA